MLPSFLLLVFLTLSASSQRILTENQQPKSFLRIPNSPGISSFPSQQDDRTVQSHPKITSKALEGTDRFIGDDEESSPIAKRMLQGPPVLTSVQHTTIRPPSGLPGPPTVMTTEIYVADGKNEEEIIIVVEDNLDPLEAIEAIENGQPQIANGEDIFISSWWTFEDEETAFENWEQLEAFLGGQYGSAPTIGIDVGAGDVPVEIEIVVPEAETTESLSPNQGTQDINKDLSTGVISLTDIILNTSAVDWGQYEQEEIDGVEVVKAPDMVEIIELEEEEGNIFVAKPKCKQVQSCQKVFVRPIGLRNVCKNQLVCPKA